MVELVANRLRDSTDSATRSNGQTSDQLFTMCGGSTTSASCWICSSRRSWPLYPAVPRKCSSTCLKKSPIKVRYRLRHMLQNHQGTPLNASKCQPRLGLRSHTYTSGLHIHVQYIFKCNRQFSSNKLILHIRIHPQEFHQFQEGTTERVMKKPSTYKFVDHLIDFWP